MTTFYSYNFRASLANTGLPNVWPRGRMRPPGPLYAAPGLSSETRAGRENYYCFADSTLLYLHR